MSLRSWSLSSWFTPLFVPLLLLLPPWSFFIKFVLLVFISTAWILAKTSSSSHPTPGNPSPHLCKSTCPTSCRDGVIAADQASLLVCLYRALPWVVISRKFGEFAERKLPPTIVVVLVWVYACLFGCNLQEADPSSVWDYESLGSFFRRKLHPGSRPVNTSSRIVIPADGTLTFCGAYTGGSLQQVKGVFYSLPKFLGRKVEPGPGGLLQKSGTCLYQTVIYLCPGDYHRFHSPARWRVEERTHIWGELLSVAPPILKNVQGLFTLNERVVLEGTWRFGYFGMVAVGATNVGSITIDCLPGLVTNSKNKYGTNSGVERRKLTNPVDLMPGQNVGNFSFGSSIVLLFEAPVGLEFLTSSFQKVKYGEHFL